MVSLARILNDDSDSTQKYWTFNRIMQLEFSPSTVLYKCIIIRRLQRNIQANCICSLTVSITTDHGQILLVKFHYFIDFYCSWRFTIESCQFPLVCWKVNAIGMGIHSSISIILGRKRNTHTTFYVISSPDIKNDAQSQKCFNHHLNWLAKFLRKSVQSTWVTTLYVWEGSQRGWKRLKQTETYLFHGI